MVKVVVGILIVSFCTFLGWLSSAKYRKRKEYLQDMCHFHDAFLSELDYGRRPIADFLATFEKKRSFYGDVIGRTEKAYNSEYEIFPKAEREKVQNYLTYIGIGDAVSQRDFFSSQSGWLKQELSLKETQAKKHTDLSVKLGFLIGLAIVILLV